MNRVTWKVYYKLRSILLVGKFLLLESNSGNGALAIAFNKLVLGVNPENGRIPLL